MRARFLAVLLGLFAVGAVNASDIPWIDPDGISGAVLLCGNKQPSSLIIQRFHELAGSQSSQIIVLAASDTGGTPLADVIPGTIIVCGPLGDQRREALIAAVTKRPETVALHFADGAAIAIHGRRIDVLGDAPITVMLAASAGRALLEIQLQSRARHD